MKQASTLQANIKSCLELKYSTFVKNAKQDIFYRKFQNNVLRNIANAC